jgi:hypothetical protein
MAKHALTKYQLRMAPLPKLPFFFHSEFVAALNAFFNESTYALPSKLSSDDADFSLLKTPLLVFGNIKVPLTIPTSTQKI